MLIRSYPSNHHLAYTNNGTCARLWCIIFGRGGRWRIFNNSKAYKNGENQHLISKSVTLWSFATTKFSLNTGLSVKSSRPKWISPDSTYQDGNVHPQTTSHKVGSSLLQRRGQSIQLRRSSSIAGLKIKDSQDIFSRSSPPGCSGQKPYWTSDIYV